MKNMAEGIAQTKQKDYSLAIESFLSVYEYVKALPDTAPVTWVYYKHLSDLMTTLGATDLSIEFGKKSYYHSRKISPAATIAVYQRAGSIGSQYITLNQFDSAAVYLQEALDIAKALKKPIFLAAAFNNIGILKEELGKPDALSFYQTALSSVPTDVLEKDELFGSLHDNLAGWYLKSGDYQTALLHCKQIYDWLGRTNTRLAHPRRRAKTILKEAQCLDRLKQTKNAITSMLANKDFFEQMNYPTVQLEYFRLLTDMLKREGRYQEMATALTAAQPIADSVSAREIRLAKLTIEGVTQVRTSAIRRDLENLELKSGQQALILEKEQQSARYRGLLLLFTLFAGSATLVLGFLFYSRKAKKLEMETMQKELTETKLLNEHLEKERLALVLESKEKDLSGLVMYISQARAWQKELLESVETMESKAGKEIQPVVRKIVSDLRGRLMVDERLKIFQDNIEVLDRRFFARLREMHPRLTAEDLQLCGYFRLNMSAKDIASMRGISLKSVNMSRYRLRKKLEIPPEEDLGIYLQSL